MKLSQLNALIVDDSAIVLSTIRNMLIHIGFSERSISIAKSPRVAMTITSDTIFDVIICDYNFGDTINGKQLFEELKQYHVMLHEAHHKRFDLSRNGERIDSRFEEGLNELLCKRSTGITMAYQEEQEMVRDIARANDTFAGNLIDMFDSGDSTGLNKAWEKYTR